MSGRVGLTTPWARRAITQPDREDIEAAMPDGWQLGVSVDAGHGYWLLWTVDPDGKASTRLRVSARMSLASACWYALRHWHIGDVTVTTDLQGWVKSIEDVA